MEKRLDNNFAIILRALNDNFEIKMGEGDNKNVAKIDATLTTFGNEDVYGDIMHKNCLDEWKKEFEKRDKDQRFLPMLFQHERTMIVGKWLDIKINNEKCTASGEIYLDDSMLYGSYMKSLIEKKMIGAVSIGFRSKKYANIEGSWAREFMEIELREASLVMYPANDKAVIDGMKEHLTSLVLTKDGEISVEGIANLLSGLNCDTVKQDEFLSRLKGDTQETTDLTPDAIVKALASALKKEQKNE